MYPILIRYVLYPLGTVVTGTRIMKFLKILEKTQWWSPEELKEYQNKMLRALIKHAYEKVPYYHHIFKERNMTPDDIRGAEDLHKLPIITKEEIRKNFNDFLAKDFNKSKLHQASTSGSTGEPLKFYITKDNISFAWASNFRAFEWTGYRLGERRATLAGLSLFPTEGVKLSRHIRAVIERNMLLPAINLTEERMLFYAEKLKKYQPKLIRGYPTALYTFANYLKKEGINNIQPKAVITTAEVLYPHYRKTLEEQFGSQVFDEYGCRDGGGYAYECSEHNGFHISVEGALMEFVKDGEQVFNGEHGEIILTDLYNYAMPFIRYAVGDVATPLDEHCACGRGLPLIKSIEGRTTDLLIFDNGIVLPGPVLVHSFTLMFKDCEVKQYQVIQKAKNKLLIKIVKDDNYLEEDTARIFRLIKEYAGENINIKLEFVDEIPTTKAGKRRYIISKVKP